MAYIVGFITKEEESQLEERGWEFEPAPYELIPKEMPLEDRPRMRMAWVDASMFEVMTGPDWEPALPPAAAGPPPATATDLPASGR